MYEVKYLFSYKIKLLFGIKKLDKYCYNIEGKRDI